MGSAADQIAETPAICVRLSRFLVLVHETGDRSSVFCPDRVIVGKGRRKVASDDDNSEITVLKAVTRLVRQIVIEGVIECGVHAVCVGCIEDQPMLSWKLIEPLVLAVPCGLPCTA